MNQTRMLTLYAPVQNSPLGQLVANFVKGGFKLQSWNALNTSGTVYEARITALPDPNDPAILGSILLCTLYEGDAPLYHRFFWNQLTLFFLLVAFAAKDPPFVLADLSVEQQAAFGAAEKVLLASDDPTIDQAARAAALSALPDAMTAVRVAMNKDDDAVAAGTLKVSKFTLFSDWVRAHDLTGSFGLPPDHLPGDEKTFYPAKDLHVAPVGNERNQFVAPNLPTPVWLPR